MHHPTAGEFPALTGAAMPGHDTASPISPDSVSVGIWPNSGVSHPERPESKTIPYVPVGSSALSEAVSVEGNIENNAIPEVKRIVRLSDGRSVGLVTYMDTPEYAAFTDKVDEGQRREYIRNGVWKPDARGNPVRGDNVQILALVDLESGDPVVGLRKDHAQTWNDVTKLPSFVKFEGENAFHPEGLEYFQQLAQNKTVVEIAGLWKDPGYGTDAKIALYRLALQESMDNGELWFLGVVSPEYRSLTNTYGDRVIHTIGNAITVQDEDATSKTRLRPVVVNPATFYSDLLTDIDALSASGNTSTSLLREHTLWAFLAGRDWSRLDRNVVSELRRRIV